MQFLIFFQKNINDVREGSNLSKIMYYKLKSLEN